tara:strand:- start:14697 stop:15767 length:1071 start_codon:yes stop_codon:yes gene_type:complete
MRKKILFIFPYNTWGGAFRSTYILSNHLIKRGWQVDIMFPIIPPRNGYKILSINWLKNKFWGLARSLIRRKKINIYCEANIKQIPWISGIWIKNYSFIIANHWNTVEDINNLPDRCGEKYHYIRDIDREKHIFHISANTFKLPLKKIVVASWISTYLNEHFAIKPEAIITNGTDIDPFILKKNKPKEISIGMYCGNLDVKGTKYGLEGISKALAKLGEIKVILFGFKKPNYTINFNYEWVQAPVGERLRDVYRKIHIFISPSLQEGYHNPPREAMAAECSLIATNVGCIPDIGRDNKNMIIVNTKDSIGIEKGILKLAKDKEFRTRISKNGFETIKKEDWRSRVDLFENLLLDRDN